jgi:hypothetical protein
VDLFPAEFLVLSSAAGATIRALFSFLTSSGT